MTRQRVTYQGQSSYTASNHMQNTNLYLCSLYKSIDVEEAVSGLIGAEIPVYGVHEEC